MGGFGDAFGDDLFITDLTVLGMTHCFLPHRSHPRSNAHPEVPQNTAGVGTSKTDSPADITPVLANKVSPAPTPALSSAFGASAGSLCAEDRFMILFAAFGAMLLERQIHYVWHSTTDFGAGVYSADDVSVAGEVFLPVAAGT